MAIETRGETAVLPIMSHYINGTAVEVLPENTGPITNPATGKVFARVPRGGVAEVDLQTSLLGETFASPIGVAPTAMQRAVHPQGERAMAAGTAGAGCLHVVSSNSGTRFEDLGGGPWWLQAYLPPEREQMVPVLEEAVEHGVRAIVLTADTPYPGTKYGVDDADWTGIDLSWYAPHSKTLGVRRCP